jgi:hypothetical protein
MVLSGLSAGACGRSSTAQGFAHPEGQSHREGQGLSWLLTADEGVHAMHLKGVFLAVMILTTTASVSESDAGVDMGVSIAEEGLGGFFLAVGNYYRIPQREVMVIRERGIPPYEVPVVLFVAKRAHVAPEIIMDLRLLDNPWLRTTLRFGLGPEIFYVPVGAVVRDPPYDKAYGYYKHKPKKEWKTIVLSDQDIINLVNLKLISEHYAYPPEKIIKMRSGGREFVLINDVIKKEKEKIKEHSEKGKWGQTSLFCFSGPQPHSFPTNYMIKCPGK